MLLAWAEAAKAGALREKSMGSHINTLHGSSTHAQLIRQWQKKQSKPSLVRVELEKGRSKTVAVVGGPVAICQRRVSFGGFWRRIFNYTCFVFCALLRSVLVDLDSGFHFFLFAPGFLSRVWKREVCSWLGQGFQRTGNMAERWNLIVGSNWKRRMWNNRKQSNWIFKRSCLFCVRTRFSLFWGEKRKCLIWGQRRRGVTTKRSATYILIGPVPGEEIDCNQAKVSKDRPHCIGISRDAPCWRYW